MVWKWDIGGRGIKNNASVCLQLKLPSTKAGMTSGGEGRFLVEWRVFEREEEEPGAEFRVRLSR